MAANICFVNGKCSACPYYKIDEDRSAKYGQTIKACYASQSQMINLSLKKNPIGVAKAMGIIKKG